MHPGIEYFQPPKGEVLKVGYDPLERTLFVEFKRSRCDYYGVPASLFERMKTAESPVGFLNENVKRRYQSLMR